MSLALSFTTLIVRLRRATASSAEREVIPVPEALRETCDVTTVQVDGRDVITLTPKANASAIEVIYTHGGSYIHPMGTFHWNLVQALIERTGATITLPLYRLAPEGRMPEAYELLDAVYAQVVARAAGQHPIFLAGDSAGGGLAIGQAIRYRDRGGPQPTGVFLFSPWVELTMTNPAIAPLRRQDAMLRTEGLVAAAAAWTDDPANPLASPINDSLADLPPLHIYQGGRELFLPDVTAFAAKAEAAGTPVTLWISPKAFHVWVAVTFLPEAKAALADVAARMTASGD